MKGKDFKKYLEAGEQLQFTDENDITHCLEKEYSEIEYSEWRFGTKFKNIPFISFSNFLDYCENENIDIRDFHLYNSELDEYELLNRKEVEKVIYDYINNVEKEIDSDLDLKFFLKDYFGDFSHFAQDFYDFIIENNIENFENNFDVDEFQKLIDDIVEF